jgi:hypothetical protein
MTLCCHLLTAWILKLPLWASDLLEAAKSDRMPFLTAVNVYKADLHGHQVAARALQSPALWSASELTGAAQEFAARIKLVVPELNLGTLSQSMCLLVPVPRVF